MHQLLQERQPVHARHLDVQRQHVGLERQNLVARHVRIGRRADHFQVRLSRQGFRQDLADDGRIVDDQNADFSVLSMPVTVLIDQPLHRAVADLDGVTVVRRAKWAAARRSALSCARAGGRRAGQPERGGALHPAQHRTANHVRQFADHFADLLLRQFGLLRAQEVRGDRPGRLAA